MAGIRCLEPNLVEIFFSYYSVQVQLFPDHSCYDSITLERTGVGVSGGGGGGVDLILTERRDETGI